MAVLDCNCDTFENCPECGGHGCEPMNEQGDCLGCRTCNGSGCRNWTEQCDGLTLEELEIR